MERDSEVGWVSKLNGWSVTGELGASKNSSSSELMDVIDTINTHKHTRFKCPPPYFISTDNKKKKNNTEKDTLY